MFGILDSFALSNLIADEVASGVGIVPLLGAGVSAASGIPLVSQLPLHLTLCIGKALGLDGKPEADGVFWHPRFGPWPAIRNDWVERAHLCQQRILAAAECRMVPGMQFDEEQWQSANNYLRAVTIARGSIGDWRLALQFLARLRPTRAKAWNDSHEIAQTCKESLGEVLFHQANSCHREGHAGFVKRLQRIIHLNKPIVELADVDQHVIDSYFNFLTAGHAPTMAHRMLVHFRQALHTNIVLTFNFDDLMEQAYKERGIRASVFEVHHESPPPAWSLLGTSPAVIKLHGGHWGLRADFSLDQDPSDRERRHFRGYFLGADWPMYRGGDIPEQPRRARNHLLIAGVSGSDGRVRHLVEDVLLKFDASFRVYWCCFTQSDVDQVKCFLDDSLLVDTAKQRLHIVWIDHIGLTFWEIYHRVTRSPAPSGLEFPASWHCMLPPALLPDEEAGIKKQTKKAKTTTERWLLNASAEPVLCLCQSTPDADEGRKHWGVTALGWLVFKQWNSQANCIWIDIEDIMDASDFAARLIEAVEFRLGCVHHAPTLEYAGSELKHDNRFKAVIDELHSLFGRSPTKWLLFFNLRGSHKYSSDIFARLNHAGTGTKEYAKHRRANCMPDRYLVDIFELIKNLLAKNDDVAGERSPFLRVVILTRTAAEATFFTKRKLCRLVEIARPAPDEEPGGWARTAVSRLMEDMLTARKRIATKNGDEGKQAEVKFHAGLRRLRSLAMFPQVKHLSSLVTRAVDGFPSDGDEGWKATDEQMNDLLRRRIIRAKTGGFLYMHWDVREELRYSLNRHFGRELEPVRADLHIGQADWSMTLFESTRDPLAAYQAVYHRCTAARLLVWGTSGNEHERLVKARVAICEAVKHLSRAHSSIFAWGNSIDASRCFKGFAQFVEVVINKTGPKNERHLQFLMKAYIESNVLHCALLRDTGRTGQLGQLVAKLQRVMSNEPPVSGKLHKAWKTFERHSRVDAKGLNFSILLERINVLVTRRRYDEAIRRCNELLEHECCGFPIEKCGSKQEPGNIWKHVYKWGEDHAKLGSDTREYRFEIRILAVQVLRRLLEIHLLQFEALLVHCDYVVGEDQVSEFTSKADAYYQTARMIPRLITNGNDPRVLVAVSRLHSIISGVMSHGRQEKRVWRHLNEAEIPASALPESESHIAKTVILLRRVYCRMQGLRWSGTLLDSYRRRRDANLANVHLTLSEEDQTKVEAWLSEINAQLDEAGRRLARDRKSLWWWVSYARYRMVWFLQREMLRSFRFQELGKAIKANAPKHTYEHLELHRLRLFQSHEMESALHLLNGVTRRVVDDSYQLCRIADTCLDITRYVAQLPSNLESLRQRTFSDALQRVLEIEGAIKNAFEGDGQRDGNVTAYINKVVEKLERECSAQPSRSRVMGSQREVDSFKA